MAIKHTIRNGNGGTVDLTLNRTNAIKYFCTECNGWTPKVDGIDHIRDCLDTLCPLYPFRGTKLMASRTHIERSDGSKTENNPKFVSQH